MSDDHDGNGRTEKIATAGREFSLSQDEMSFLEQEGIDMLLAYRSIRDRRKRELILELTRAIAEDQPKVDGR